jgi:hypothetical protein
LATTGPTNIDVGIPLCSAHHHLVHEGGWDITYNTTTGITTLVGPQTQVIETQPYQHSPLTGRFNGGLAS